MSSDHTQSARERWESILARPEQRSGEEIKRWDWCALLRLIQCAYPEYPRVGYSLSLEQDVVRLGQPAFFHPPMMTIADFATQGPREKPPADSQSSERVPKDNVASPIVAGGVPKAWIYSYHLGLFGPFGPMPLHLTLFAHRRNRAGDPAFLAFCNVLIHRFLCFFFRAWAEGRKEITLDRPKALTAGHRAFARQDIAEHGEECWEFFVGSLIGCGLDSLRSRDRLPEEARLFYAGRLLNQTRNAEGLRAIIQHYYDVHVELIEFQPRTLPIPPSARWNLGAKTSNGRLGWSTLVGESVMDYQSGFRIRIGPLSLAQMEGFFPDTEGFDHLHDWVRFYCGKESDPNPDSGIEAAWDLQLVLQGPEVPKLEIKGVLRLGLNTWLCSSQPKTDMDDLLLRPRIKLTARPAMATSRLDEE